MHSIAVHASGMHCIALNPACGRIQRAARFVRGASVPYVVLVCRTFPTMMMMMIIIIIIM